jgi:hypothetical protein
MPEHKPQSCDVEKMVHQEILRILAQHHQHTPPLSNAHRLDNDLGLTSAELLQLFSLLSVRLQVNPVELSASTMHVRTVGDLCRMYQALLTRATNTSNASAILLASQQRAQARRARRESAP